MDPAVVATAVVDIVAEGEAAVDTVEEALLHLPAEEDPAVAVAAVTEFPSSLLVWRPNSDEGALLVASYAFSNFHRKK